jgi:hypothetical protein
MNAGHEKFSKRFENVMGEIREDFVQQVRNKMKALKCTSSRLKNRKYFFCVEGMPRFEIENYLTLLF